MRNIARKLIFEKKKKKDRMLEMKNSKTTKESISHRVDQTIERILVAQRKN